MVEDLFPHLPGTAANPQEIRVGNLIFVVRRLRMGVSHHYDTTGRFVVSHNYMASTYSAHDRVNKDRERHTPVGTRFRTRLAAMEACAKLVAKEAKSAA